MKLHLEIFFFVYLIENHKITSLEATRNHDIYNFGT